MLTCLCIVQVYKAASHLKANNKTFNVHLGKCPTTGLLTILYPMSIICQNRRL